MHLRKRHLLHNLHTMQKDLHRRNREKIGGPLSRTPTRCRKNDTDASKPVARHFNLPNHSHHNMTICGLSLHHGNTAVKISNKNLFFNWAHSIHTESMNASHAINLFTNSRHPISTNSKLLRTHINLQPQFLYSLRRRANARNVSFPNL